MRTKIPRPIEDWPAYEPKQYENEILKRIQYLETISFAAARRLNLFGNGPLTVEREDAKVWGRQRDGDLRSDTTERVPYKLGHAAWDLILNFAHV